MGKNKTRTFSYTTPIMFQGTQYPSTEMDIEDTSGNVSNRKVFVDNKGQYYTLNNNGQAIPVSLLHQLDEVTVTPDKENLLSKQFNDYLTNSSDATQVQNVPHAEYNPNLTAETLHGAKVNNAWVKDHPNASAWGNFIGAVPFAVAAYPFAAAAGQGVMGTAIGQAARSGLSTFMANPIVDAANTALGLGFAAKGTYDVSQGEFTPETVMDLAGGTTLLAKGSGLFDKLLIARKTTKTIEEPSMVDDAFANIKNAWPLKGETEIPIGIKAEAAKKYSSFINSREYQDRLKRANLEDHWDYMKDLTNRRVNNVDYFPGKVKAEIENDPDILGTSAIDPTSPNYGITLKENLSSSEIPETLMHEVSHWATGNAGVNDIGNSIRYPFKYDQNSNYIGDIMRYNESIAPNILWEDILKNFPKSISIDKLTELEKQYRYLVKPTEKRARAMSIYQLAKDHNMTTDNFIDKFTRNGRITDDAPIDLQQLNDILTTDNIKKYLKNFLSISVPIGITTYKNK